MYLNPRSLKPAPIDSSVHLKKFEPSETIEMFAQVNSNMSPFVSVDLFQSHISPIWEHTVLLPPTALAQSVISSSPQHELDVAK